MYVGPQCSENWSSSTKHTYSLACQTTRGNQLLTLQFQILHSMSDSYDVTDSFSSAPQSQSVPADDFSAVTAHFLAGQSHTPVFYTDYSPLSSFFFFPFVQFCSLLHSCWSLAELVPWVSSMAPPAFPGCSGVPSEI